MLLVAIWAVILLAATVQKDRLLQISQNELAQLRGAVAQHALGLFRNVDSALHVIDRWLAANPRIDPRSEAHFIAMVSELRRTSNGLFDLNMVSTDGKLYAISMPDGKPPVDVSDSSFYKAQLSNPERKLHIGEPVLIRGSDKWTVPISWRLEKPVSGMLVVLANVEIARLVELHDSLRFKPNGAIVFIRSDGVALSRAPYEQAFIGRDAKNSYGFREEYGVKQSGFYVSDGSFTDGVPRLISYQRLEDYPVTVLVNRGLEDILSVFKFRRGVLFAVAALLTLVALAFTWKLHISQRALLQAQRDLQRIEATDSLTGMMSRRAFLELAHREFSRAQRYQRPAAVLVLDLDHFKKVNDAHGHPVGDNVLRDCAAAWLAALRDQDVPGRVGGEEFFAVLPETSLEAALLVAERLRKAVSELQFEGSSGAFSVTVSIGLAMVSPGDADLANTIERADRALYLAKQSGRDRVANGEEMTLVS